MAACIRLSINSCPGSSCVHCYRRTDWKTVVIKLPRYTSHMRPCSVNYCKLVYGNVFYIVRSAKLAWLLYLCNLLTIQDGGLGHLEFRQIFNF